MDEDVQHYIDSIPHDRLALFERVHHVILDTCLTVEVVFSYKMPAYQHGTRRLHVGVWKHGVSIYGWKATGDGGLTDRHPDLQTSTGTIASAPTPPRRSPIANLPTSSVPYSAASPS